MRARSGPRSPPRKEAADGYRLGCRQGRRNGRRGPRPRLLRQSGNLGRRRLRAVRRPAGQDPVDQGHRAARQALGRHRQGAGRRRAAARRGHRGQDRRRADAGPGDRRGRGHHRATRARKWAACRPAPRTSLQNAIALREQQALDRIAQSEAAAAKQVRDTAVDVALGATRACCASRSARASRRTWSTRRSPSCRAACTEISNGIARTKTIAGYLWPPSQDGGFSFAAAVVRLAPAHTCREDRWPTSPLPSSATSPVACSRASSASATGSRSSGLGSLDPIYKALLDRPITVTLGLIGPDGTVGLTPMWFDYEGDQVLVNIASHRRKCDWIRKSPRFTILIVNPENAYHWVQLKCSVDHEERGMGAGRRAGDAPARQDLDEIHRQPAALRPARSRHRREARAVRLQRRPHRNLRQAVSRR